ncbi:MAG TPA: hypothetical protein VEA81_01705 [Burkholderiaceae bacterium]|nr:hypothetical protein [Burkholderiaceae bacterium]
MTRTVIATFPDGEAARRAAVALGRTELAAGPTRVQVAASGPARNARLELRVEDPDASRAIALLREHGADVVDPDHDGRDLRSGGVLAGWGMAVADAVTAAMAGATASDAQVPSGAPPTDPTSADRGNRPAERAGGAARSAPPVFDATAVSAASPIGVDAPGGATDPSVGRSGPASSAPPSTTASTPSRASTPSGASAPFTAATPPMTAPTTPSTASTTSALSPSDGADAPAARTGEAPAEILRGLDRLPVAGEAAVWGNAPTPAGSQAGTASGTHISDTASAGTESSLGQIGPGSSLTAAMGATDATGTASGTRTREDPRRQARADDVPMEDPRPRGRRPKSDA